MLLGPLFSNLSSLLLVPLDPTPNRDAHPSSKAEVISGSSSSTYVFMSHLSSNLTAFGFSLVCFPVQYWSAPGMHVVLVL